MTADTLCFYGPLDGALAIGIVDSTGQLLPGGQNSYARRDWSHIVATGDNVAFYAEGDGSLTTGWIRKNGHLVELKSTKIIAGCTHVVDIKGRLLFYRAGDGKWLMAIVDFLSGELYQPNDGSAAAGWDHIV